MGRSSMAEIVLIEDSHEVCVSSLLGAASRFLRVANTQDDVWPLFTSCGDMLLACGDMLLKSCQAVHRDCCRKQVIFTFPAFFQTQRSSLVSKWCVYTLLRFPKMPLCCLYF